MTAVLSNSQNSEHICPICNSKYNNVGNFKLHMKNHDNEQLREQRNALLSEMIANSFSKLVGRRQIIFINQNKFTTSKSTRFILSLKR